MAERAAADNPLRIELNLEVRAIAPDGSGVTLIDQAVLVVLETPATAADGRRRIREAAEGMAGKLAAQIRIYHE